MKRPRAYFIERANWLPAGPCPHFPESLALPPPLYRFSHYIEIPSPCHAPDCTTMDTVERVALAIRSRSVSRQLATSGLEIITQRSRMFVSLLYTLTCISTPEAHLPETQTTDHYRSILLLTSHAYLNRSSSLVSYSVGNRFDNLNVSRGHASPRLCQRLNYYVICHFEQTR